MSIVQKLKETTAFIQQQFAGKPVVGIVLGSGLGNLASEIIAEKEIPYETIPHFPVTTVDGHHGRLIFGTLGDKPIVAMAGRFHCYEGYSGEEVTYPIRVMRMLGVEILLLSNAAGSMNSAYKVGDLMIIKDHISMFIPNPLIGKNEEELGPRFPDMSEPYSKALIQKARAIADKHAIPIHTGVYVSVTGPTFETPAEYRMLHILGADVVGMSTVQEVIVARHAGMTVFGVSIVTDIGLHDAGDAAAIITHEEVLAAAKATEPSLTILLKELIATI